MSRKSQDIDQDDRRRNHRPRLGRHQRAEQPAAALVAVELLPDDRLGHWLCHRLSGMAVGERRHGRSAWVFNPRRSCRRNRTLDEPTPICGPHCAADLTSLRRPDLHRFAVAGGAAVFRANCSQCHGSGAAGAKGYPNLLDDDWLWGGDIETIAYHPPWHPQRDDDDARYSQMPAFGDILETKKSAMVAVCSSLSVGS